MNREYQKIQTAWWSNYIVKNAYQKIFNINLIEDDPADRKLLREIYLWTDREKIRYPDQHVFDEVIRLIIKKGTVKQIKHDKIIFNDSNDYQERISRSEQYIARLEPLAQALRNNNFYTADIEAVLGQLRTDLIKIKMLSDSVIQQTNEVESVIAANERDYKKRLLISSANIFGVILFGYFVIFLWKKIKKRNED